MDSHRYTNGQYYTLRIFPIQVASVLVWSDDSYVRIQLIDFNAHALTFQIHWPVQLTEKELETWLDDPESQGRYGRRDRKGPPYLQKNPGKTPDGYDDVRSGVVQTQVRCTTN